MYDYLTHMKYSVFWDEDIHNGRFDAAIYKAIDECKDFILIVSPKAAEFDSKDNNWGYGEDGLIDAIKSRTFIKYALKMEKKICGL